MSPRVAPLAKLFRPFQGLPDSFMEIRLQGRNKMPLLRPEKILFEVAASVLL
jgi:hypothetical protein